METSREREVYKTYNYFFKRKWFGIQGYRHRHGIFTYLDSKTSVVAAIHMNVVLDEYCLKIQTIEL